MNPFPLLAFMTILAVFETSVASAYDILPYTTRTRNYSGWSTTVQGDLRSVGMAGATVGSGDSFLDATDNPASLAVTTNDANANFAENIIFDRNIQAFDNSLRASNIAASFSSYPWGFGINYRSRVLEGQPYAFASAPDSPVNYSIRTGDIYLSGARLFFEDRLAVGTTLILGQAEERAESPGSTFSDPGQTWAFGFGASWQFPSHLVLGMNFSPNMRYQFSDPKGASPQLKDFLQTIHVPFVFGMGLGWMPNRFFRAGIGFHILGATDDTALLRDDSVLVGVSPTFHPKLGFSYLALDYPELQVTFNLGTYLETSRIQDVSTRPHLTTSIELVPWIFAFGAGVDAALYYRNYIFSFGLDLVKTLEKLSLIPRGWHPPRGGAFPKIFHQSDEGLPRALTRDWKPHGDANAIEVGLAIPAKIAEALAPAKPVHYPKKKAQRKKHTTKKTSPHPVKKPPQ